MARAGEAMQRQQQQQQQLPQQPTQNMAQQYMAQLRQQNPNAGPQQIWDTMKHAKSVGMFDVAKGVTGTGASGEPSSRMSGVEGALYQDAIKRGLSPQEAADTAGKFKTSQAADTAGSRAEEKHTVDLAGISLGAKDVLNTYSKLKKDSSNAPSGALESGIASAANYLNIPTEGSIAQGTFDADVNNLFLATIRTLKGTGRVMLAEINAIKEAAPLRTDSNAVKQSKIEAHMEYYRGRMKDLGFDPDTGKPLRGGENVQDTGSSTAPYSQDDIEAEIKRRGL
jgi:hypothetical protein